MIVFLRIVYNNFFVVCFEMVYCEGCILNEKNIVIFSGGILRRVFEESYGVWLYFFLVY